MKGVTGMTTDELVAVSPDWQ